MWLWIASITLIGLGLLFFVSQWIYVLFIFDKTKDGGYSFAPFISGVLLFLGMLLLPVELPIPRVLAATLAMCLDHTISIGIPWLIWMLLRGDFKQD